MTACACLALAMVAWQEPEPLGPTPPPDRYDDAYDARLFEAWGGFEAKTGARDNQLPPQPPPLRPKVWRVFEGDWVDREARETWSLD